ncbi:MAG: glycosyltransferase [Bacilli bacterium]
MNSDHAVALIIPAYRPNQNLVVLIQRLQKTFFGPIIVVDDGNQDQDIFKKLTGITLLHHSKNLGKGAALKTAFKYVLKKLDTVYGVVTADADGQHPYEDILKMIHLIDQESDSFYIGTRLFDNKTPLRNRLGNLITRKVFSWVTKQTIMDTQNGLRAIPKWLLQKLILIPQNRYDYEMAMLKLIALQGVNMVQVPVKTIYNQEGAISSFNPWKDSILIYQILLKSFVRFIFVGLLSFLIDYALFLFFYELIEGSWRIILAVLFARVLSGIFNYGVNRFYTFESDVRFVKSSIQYLVLFLLIMALSAFFTDAITSFNLLSHQFAKILVDSILFIISYRVQKKYIFKK